MRCLAEFREREDVRRLIDRCRESKEVQGVNIRLSRPWLAAWRLGERHNPLDPPDGFETAVKLDDERLWDYMSRPWLPIRALRSKDLAWRPRFLFNSEPPLPIVFTIRLYPDAGFPKELQPIEQERDFELVYQACPVAYLYSGPRSLHRPVVGGISIGVNTTDYGTLGGILRDRGGHCFGITCAHVASTYQSVQQPSEADGGKGKSIGKVIYSEMPLAFPTFLPENRLNQTRYAGRVDVAVIEIDTAQAQQEILSLGRIKDIFPSDHLEQDHHLEMTGRTSDWKVLFYGGETCFHNLHIRSTGDVCCYEDPIILRDPTGNKPVDGGDSGAWICVPGDDGYHWAGMVVGGDGQVGFAVSADALKNWWEASPRQLKLAVS
jgi:hypothetical protein